VVSGFEAIAGSVTPTRSFTPIVYVDAPSRAVGFDAGGRGARQVMLLLPTTANVRRWTLRAEDASMVARVMTDAATQHPEVVASSR
jgi:hypothetical protein